MPCLGRGLHVASMEDLSCMRIGMGVCFEASILYWPQTYSSCCSGAVVGWSEAGCVYGDHCHKGCQSWSMCRPGTALS